GNRIELRPIRPQALDRLRAIADEAPTLELERRDRPHDLGLKRGAEFLALAQDDVGDRAGVTGVGLAWPLVTALAVGAPGRDVQNLEAGRGKGGNERAPVAAGALDANDRFVGSVVSQPGDQMLISGRAVGDGEDADLATTLIDQ